MDELYQEFPATTAVIAWHIYDEFEFPAGMVRTDWYEVEAYPTIWFDGVIKIFGEDQPMFPIFLPIYEGRIDVYSNFNIEMEISNVDVTDYNVNTTIELLAGVNTENLALFVVLTESDLESPGVENQNFVARNIYPDGMGLPIDFSAQTIQTFNTLITLEDEYVSENCEVVAFIQNMDTKEIYQGNSKMMTEIVGIKEVVKADVEVFPNPASDRVTIKSVSSIDRLEIYNQVGQLVKQIDTDSNILNLNVSELDSGIYFIKIFSHDNVITRKLVID